MDLVALLVGHANLKRLSVYSDWVVRAHLKALAGSGREGSRRYPARAGQAFVGWGKGSTGGFRGFRVSLCLAYGLDKALYILDRNLTGVC
jgi:hypothetical protein